MMMQKTQSLLLGLLISFVVKAQDHRYDPPWNTPPQSKVMFTIPGVDNVPDLYGDIVDPDLVIFFAGNQFMCIDELLAAFKKQYPAYPKIFAETLPPGILAKQIDSGSLTVGNMRITLRPDIYTAGKAKIVGMAGKFADTVTYAFNKLAILVRKGNPKHVRGLTDLERADVRVSMPNPTWEGVGRQIEQAYEKAGGARLRAAIMERKVKDGSTFLTQIHHRQTPMRIMYEQSDAGPVWYSEAFYQQVLGHPVEVVPIADQYNIEVAYMAGQLRLAPHAEAAKDFMRFMRSDAAKTIYRKYGFTTP